MHANVLRCDAPAVYPARGAQMSAPARHLGYRRCGCCLHRIHVSLTCVLVNDLPFCVYFFVLAHVSAWVVVAGGTRMQWCGVVGNPGRTIAPVGARFTPNLK